MNGPILTEGITYMQENARRRFTHPARMHRFKLMVKHKNNNPLRDPPPSRPATATTIINI